MTKSEQYAAKITAQLFELFNDECENHIDISEMGEGNNATDFIHALSNIAPNLITTRLTGSMRTMLEFNHLANQLVFQYSQLEKATT